MSALDSDHVYGFTLLTPTSMGDLNSDSPTPRGYNPGGVFFANTPGGLRIFRYVQNRHTAGLLKGALMSSLGDTDGKTQVTTSGVATANTKVKATTSGLTANDHQGGGFYVQNSAAGAGVPPEGEETYIAGNSATEILLESGNPLSATITPGDTINLVGLYNSQIAAIGDLAYQVQGVVVGSTGISAGNYGFVACQGRTPNTLVKAGTALAQNDALVADAGRVGPAIGSAAAANLHVGSALHVVQVDSVSDKTTVMLSLGLGYNPGTLDASA